MPPSSSTPESGLFDPLLARGPVREATADAAWLQAMLDVEAALARALAQAGVIAPHEADAIAAACHVDSYDIAAIGAQAAATGNPVPALVRALTAQVEGPAAAHVHRGATSQDILDTAAMLVARRAITALVADLRSAADEAARLARAHRDTPMAGRTLLQHAAPITFGLKAAGWMSGLDETAGRLDEVCDHRLVVQLGGAAGTLASLGNAGLLVRRHLAADLELAEPVLPWHTMRIPLADVTAALGVAAGVVAKVAGDVILLAQTEIAEVVEEGPNGRGGSSTLPQKRNPVAAVTAVACSRQAPGLVATLLGAMAHEHERAAGAWHAEWQPFTALLRGVGSAAAWLRDSLTYLHVDPTNMKHNLDRTGGMLMAERVTTALIEDLGRLAAHDVVRDACSVAAREGRTLQDVLADMPEVADRLDPAALARLLDPTAATGHAATMVDRALAAHPGSPS